MNKMATTDLRTADEIEAELEDCKEEVNTEE